MKAAIVGSRLGMDVMNLSLTIPYQSDDYYQVFRDIARHGRLGKGCLIVQVAQNFGDDNRKTDLLTTTDLVIGVGGLTLEQDGSSQSWKRSCTSGYNVDVFVSDRRAFRVQKSWEWEVFDWMLADPDTGGDVEDSEFIHYTWIPLTGRYPRTSTSFSAPVVTGILGLMLSGNPSLTREEATQILFHTSSRPDANNLLEGIPFDGDVETYCRDNFAEAPFPPDITAADLSFSPVTGRSKVYGHGLVNALAAVQAVHRRKNWPSAVQRLSLMPAKPATGANRYVRVTWEPSELNKFPRDFDGVMVVRSRGPLSHAPEDGLAPASQSWSSDGGVVILNGTTEREFLDTQQTPTGLRVYSVFYYKVNSLINPSEANYYTYSFGAEARIRFEPSRWKAVTTIGALQTELTGGLNSGPSVPQSIVVFADFQSANLLANLTTGPNATGSQNDGCVYVVGRSNAFSNPATIVRTGGAGTIAIAISGATHLVLSNLKVQGGEVGVKVADVPGGARAENVQIYNCRWEGQDVGSWLENEGKVVVQNNVIVNAGACGIPSCAGIFLPDHGTTKDETFYTIMNNTIDVANRPCLRVNMLGLGEGVQPGDNQRVRLQVFNNILSAGGTGACVYIASVAHVFVCNNNCFSRVDENAVCGKAGAASFASLAEWRPIVLGEKNGIEAVPGLLGGGNYHLAGAGSACINRGTEEIYDSVGVPFDMDGGARIRTTSVAGGAERTFFVGRDIGADELGVEDIGRAFKRGDADNNGLVEITDQVFIYNFLYSGGNAPICMDAADANDDERVDGSDGVYIVNMLFNHSGFSFPSLFSFPEPSPECGFDLVQQATPVLTCNNPTWCDDVP